MMDQRQRVWATAAVRAVAEPRVLQAAPTATSSARTIRWQQSSRQAAVYDPRTQKTTPVDTCYATHHLQFAEDKDNTLYFSGDTNVIGWINTRIWDETGDAAKAQGWCPLIVDTNGDGKIGAYTQPNEKPDPTRDMRVAGFAYGIIVNPTDGSIWYANAGVPGRIGRLELGSNPPLTCKTEVFEPPYNPPNVITGFTPRGIDVDRNGVLWTGLSGGPHMASFDRRKCKTLNGPTATGQHCAEGWTLYPAPGPQMKGTDIAGSADFSYYNWVDQLDTLGLGRERADHERLGLRLAARPRQRQVRRAARAVSARLLLTRARRPDRRSEGRLEGQGRVGRLRNEPGVAHRRQHRRAQRAGQVPAEARSAGEVSRGVSAITVRREDSKSGRSDVVRVRRTIASTAD